MRIHLSDPSNMGDNGHHEFTGTAEQAIAYLDGAVRGDTHEHARHHIDAAINALRDLSEFDEAAREARAIGVYLTRAKEE